MIIAWTVLITLGFVIIGVALFNMIKDNIRWD